jgi:16S rRNA (cytidine1402-2'-O)-methyltransferase
MQMPNKGKLFLIPNTIAEAGDVSMLTPQLIAALPAVTNFLAENIRTARRYLSSLKIYSSVETLNFFVLDKDTAFDDLNTLMAPLLQDINMGVISESGCPGIADPGAIAVQWAHVNDIKVVPLVGPSSILLALMASGLNGQNFAFHGYLPIDSKSCGASIRAYEKESNAKNQTQIFIETPYRNNSVLQVLLKELSPSTLLTIALDLTGPSEMIATRTVKQWRSMQFSLEKIPAVFLFLA